MGQSTDGILAYGYDLGGDSEWRLADTPATAALAEEGYWDTETAETALLAAVGFVEVDYKTLGYFDRRRAAQERVGVKLMTYCSLDYPQYLLVAHAIRVYRGDVKEIDMGELAEAPLVHGWDDKLRAALETLGLTPTQERAKWLLVSYWG